MKIYAVVRTLAMMRGGGELYCLKISEELKKLGADVEMVTGRPLFKKILYPIDNFHTHYLRSPYLRSFAYRTYKFHIGFIFNILDQILFNIVLLFFLFLRKNKFDILWITGGEINCWVVKKFIKKPLYIRLPGPLPDFFYYRKILQSADGVIANGDAYLRVKKQRIPGVKLFNIPPGVDSKIFHRLPHREELRRKLGVRPDEIAVLFVGRFVNLKNLPFLIRLGERVMMENEKIKFILIGEGALLPEIKKLAKKTKNASRFIFLGEIENKKLPEFYSAGDIFLLTSSYDNFPNAVLEAMACGLPIVASRVGGLPLQVLDERSGFLFIPNNLEDARKKIMQLTNDAELRKGIGEYNQKLIVQKYNWEKSAQELNRVFMGLKK